MGIGGSTARNKKFATALEAGNTDKAISLIKKGIDMDSPICRNEYRWIKPIRRAIELGDLNIFEILLSAGARVDFNDKHLFEVSFHKNYKIFKKLLILGSQNKRISEKTYKKILLFLAEEGDDNIFPKWKEAIEYLLGLRKPDSDTLFFIVRFHRLETVKTILTSLVSKIDINSIVKSDEMIFENLLISFAAVQSREDDAYDKIKLLLSLGFDPNLSDRWGRRSLHYVTTMGRKKSARSDLCGLLISANAEVNVQDHKGRTPLHRAAEYHHTEQCGTLLKAGANISATDHSGNTPLHSAVEDVARIDIEGSGWSKKKTDYSLCNLLISQSNVNRANNEGDTPLHIAVRAALEGNYCVLNLLLRRGADVKATNLLNYTPLMALGKVIEELNKDITRLGEYSRYSRGELEEKFQAISEILSNQQQSLLLRDEARTRDEGLHNGKTEASSTESTHSYIPGIKLFPSTSNGNQVQVSDSESDDQSSPPLRP